MHLARVNPPYPEGHGNRSTSHHPSWCSTQPSRSSRPSVTATSATLLPERITIELEREQVLRYG
ncbi:MAG: hypothetical protein ACO3LA_06960, partial [Ilumatobacteraceae bacterium]